MGASLERRGQPAATLQLGKSGQFDVSVDGKLVYSRYQTGRFPTEADLDAAFGAAP
ncbi:MAG: Rdx family protein [Burkholderiales bacterium]